MKDNWSSKPFAGDPAFNLCSPRDKHLEIRRNVQVYPPNLSEISKHTDPSWHSRVILEETCKAFSSRAFISGALSYDELSLETKCRTRASTYVPNKPDKFGVRMFGLSSAGPGCPPCLFSFV